MREQIEAVGQLADVASDIEIGLAELGESLEGETKTKALSLREMTDRLADSLTVLYVELAKAERALTQDMPGEDE